ncbi:hypothetical protein JZU71_00230 [bacterium]|nr:hypothetical protein [bacterium]
MIITIIIIIAFVIAVIDQFTGRRMSKAGIGQVFAVLICIGVGVLLISNIGMSGIWPYVLAFIGLCVLAPVCMAVYIVVTRDKSNTAVDAYIESQKQGRK